MATDKPSTVRVEREPKPAVSRFRTVACLGGISLERGVDAAEIRTYLRDPSNVVWVDVQDPGPEELSVLLEDFGFHPLALEDVAKGHQRPKVDEYKGYLFVVTYAIVSGDSPIDLRTAEVDLFVGRNYVVSIHRQRVPALEEAMVRWTRGGEMLREGVGFLVYTLMDAIIDAYFPLIDAIEDEMDESEIDMFTRAREGGIENLLQMKRSLFRLRRVLYPLREAFHVFLRRDQPIFSASTHVYFHDVYDHILRILDVLDMERDMVSGALDAYLTIISNRLNATMKTLTVITIVVAIAGSVFGAWGMNVPEIPLADTPFGFWWVMAGTALLIVGTLYLCRKRGWL
jgi:magnesium transporter